MIPSCGKSHDGIIFIYQQNMKYLDGEVKE